MASSAPVSASASAPTNDDIEAVIQMATSNRQSPDSRSSIPLKDTRTQLFVGNLPYRVRWQDLKDLFRRAGTVLRADVSLGPDNRSRGYGTVLLATAEDAGRAIDMLNGYSWQTRVLEVRPDRLGTVGDFDAAATSYVPPGSAYPVVYDEFAYGAGDAGAGMRNLFVGNLPFHIQWQDLKDLFRAAGAVARADVALGPDGRSRGFGTVVYASEEGAERGRRMFDGYEFNGRPLKVHYDKFTQSTQPVPLSLSIPPTTISHLEYAQYGALAQHSQLDSMGQYPPLDPTGQHLQLDSMGQQRSQLDAHSSLDSLGHHSRLDTLDALAQRSDSLAERLHLDGYRQPSASSSQYAPPALDHSKSDPVVRSHYTELGSSHSQSQSQSQSHSPLTQDLLAQTSHLESLIQGQLQPLKHSLTQRQLDSLTQRQLDSVTQRQLDSLTTSQLEALILQSQSQAQSLSQSQSRSSHSQSQTHSNSLAPTPNHSNSLSRAGSLTGSPHPTFASPHSAFTAISSTSPHSASFANTSASSPHPARGLKLNLSEHASPRPSISVPTSQAVSPQQRGLVSFSAGAEQRGGFGSGAETFSATTSSSRPSFSASTSQRPSFSASTSQKPSFSASSSARPSFSASTSQRPSFNASSILNGPSSLLSGPFLDDPPHSSTQSSSRTALNPLLGASPPPTGGWPTLGMSRDGEQSTSRDVAQSILSDRQSSDRKPASSTGPVRSGSKGTMGEVDYVTSALGALGMRRASRVTSPNSRDEGAENDVKTDMEKDKSTRPQPQRKSPPRARVPSSQSPSHTQAQTQPQAHPAHPGPIALPPPSPFAVPMLSPHYTAHSPLYHPYYMGQHPQSPMYHPGAGHAGSPLHHPGHAHPLGSPHPHMAGSPLHHPGHGFHHPLHYGVMTPHGLPPITPSMPPFTFLHPQSQPQQQANGHGNEAGNGLESSSELNGSTDGQQRQQQQQQPLPTPPLYYPHPQPQHPQYQHQHQHPPPRVHFHHPQMFSPGIPLSPGIMIPVGMVPVTPGGVPMTPSGVVPVPMTPGVAMTPGVRAFWPNAPWINPAVGAPVRVDEERDGNGGGSGEGEGYFPPVFGGSTSSGQGSGGVGGEDIGYFPPVSVANEILKEGSEFGAGAREGTAGRKARRRSTSSPRSGSRSSRSPSTSAWMTSPSPDKEDEGAQSDKGKKMEVEKHGLTRTTSQHEPKREYHDGTGKRGSLTHRPESDPVVHSEGEGKRKGTGLGL